MTDIEINIALALAIGYKDTNLADNNFILYVWHGSWKKFDYRDWNVIGPIAERYDCFPLKAGDSWLSRYLWRGCGVQANTPQKAIALAVIGAKK